MDIIGEGTYGIVYEALQQNQKVSVKILKAPVDQNKVNQEVAILQQCQHKNVVQYYEVVHRDN
jgi:serine/threonine protein kinase